MIHVISAAPLIFFVSYCLARADSVASVTVAVAIVGLGIGSTLYRRRGLLGVGTLLAVMLYAMTIRAGSESLRIYEPMILGSALFVHVDIAHDLIALRIRRSPLKSFLPRIRASVSTPLLSAGTGVAILSLGVSVAAHIPVIGTLTLFVPALALSAVGYIAFVNREARSRDEAGNVLPDTPRTAGPK